MINRHKVKDVAWKHRFDTILIDLVTLVSLIYIVFLIADLYVADSVFGLHYWVYFDTFVSFLFLFEFSFFFLKAKNKLTYTKGNYLDLLAGIPLLLISQGFALYMLFNIFKLLRGFENLLKIYEFIIKKRLNLLNRIIILFFLVVVYFSLLIVNIEKSSNTGLDSFQDGVWWAVATITSVGYGDVVPMTLLGKLVAIFLMVFGIGLSSAVGALFVSWLLKPGQEKIFARELEIAQSEEKSLGEEKRIEKIEKKILDKLDDMEEEIAELKKDK